MVNPDRSQRKYYTEALAQPEVTPAHHPVPVKVLIRVFKVGTEEGTPRCSLVTSFTLQETSLAGALRTDSPGQPE